MNTPSARIAPIACGLVLFASLAAAQAQSLPYTQDFQSMTAGTGPTGLTYTKANASSGTTGPAVSPATASSSGGPVGLLVIDSTTTPLAAFADPSTPPASPNKALRIYDYNNASSGTNQAGLQQVLVSGTSAQISAASLSFDFVAPVTLTTGSGEYLNVAFGAYSTSQILNSGANRVVEVHLGNDGTFGYSAATGQNGTLSTTTIPSGVNRLSIFANTHNSQVATYTYNGASRTLAPNSVDVWNYNYTTSTYTQVGSGLGLKNTTSYDAGSDAEIGLFGFFAGGSSSNANVDFIIDNIKADTLPLSAPTAPAITTQPANVSVAAGGNATFTAVVSGAPTSYQWSKDGTALANGAGASGVVIAGATTATLTLTGVQSADAGSYKLAISNAAGSASSNAATLTVTGGGSGATAPAITTQPANQTVAPGSSASFTVVATGTAPLTYQWSKGATAITGATSATYTIASAQAADAGSYTVTVTNATGSVTSSAATLTVSTGGGGSTTAPAITTQPASVSATVGGSASFTVAASGTAPLTYQWNKGGAAISGATSATYTLASVQATDAGSYTVTVTNAGGSVTSNAATLTVASAGTGGRLVNVSGRGAIGSGDGTLIIGFSFGGTASKSVLIRADGPALKTYGVSSAVADPSLQLLKGSTVQSSNDNWDGATATITATAQAGAFPLTAGSLDSAIVSTLAPGLYTATITAPGSGVALGEVYETTTGLPDSSRFLNFSVRGQVGAGDNVLVVGFVVSGGSKRILIRGVGPALTGYGLAGAVSDPQITLYSGTTVVSQNDNWDGAAATTTAFGQAGAFSFAAGSKDAAIVTTLQPGAYTVVLTGVGSATGVGMIEIYDLP